MYIMDFYGPDVDLNIQFCHELKWIEALESESDQLIATLIFQFIIQDGIITIETIKTSSRGVMRMREKLSYYTYY